MTRRTGPRGPVAALVALVLLVTGCTAPIDPYRSGPIVVATTGSPTTLDPVFAADAASQDLVTNVYERLLMIEPKTGQARPEAAQECKFTAPTVYLCSLRDKTWFHNGNPVTAEDIKFSIERAKRIGGERGRIFDVITDITIPSERRLEFHLARPDHQIAAILATPQASIVDHRTVGLTEMAPTNRESASGPLVLRRFEPGLQEYERYGNYQGARWAAWGRFTVRQYTEDGLARALQNPQSGIDVVWHGLRDGGRPPNDWQEVVAPEGQARWLRWNPTWQESRDPAMRAWLVAATTELRNWDSVIPPSMAGHTTTFPMPPVAPGQRPKLPGNELRIGYVSSVAGLPALAEQLRFALQYDGTIVLSPDRTDVAVFLEEIRATTPGSYLQPWLADLPADRRAQVQPLYDQWVSATTEPDRVRLLGDLQRAVAEDGTVVPLTIANDRIWLAPDIQVRTNTEREHDIPNWGTGYTLGLWGLYR
ncbi:ABC transporter substrate-binding protein [Granulicoccus phenolivorans]|uniref:ABC transporter substrate-binding protein n=1 Tax=Granulicoccus phenolivorans TaxID=266854 RepID=UPI0004052226|nr:ABC transporter substrate-binding protein [Granulicoccus phenolivorans]